MGNTKAKVNIKTVLFLQFAVCIYTFATVFSKFAASYGAGGFLHFLSDLFCGKNPELSLHNVGFGLFAGLQLLTLFVYAVLWQQIIKRIDLSVAYINRAVALLWSALWAVLIFNERITVTNVMGIVIILAGTFLVNSDA